ncbi:MAG TPA: TetR/AcrR family transcriptional regulator [Desulfobacteraceae bacterium]|nr:TetR/AcrR family transcriptional regulator [Deltaproteobacteria bacterium]MBW1953680.1 TetR/AcrR family transcriptional regulator [Deltaproteobacteria bacterium]OQY01778.1 MAG: TetR family transcriptional regulator [Desulfobacteraceae bacterium 4572_123]HDZ24319.1 TetR/AcrR family transcriptional regulator [Desulfobacteraceae bacterium]
MKNKKLPRREREKLRQRQEMLAAALELFSEKGYHNVSMHEIAEKAEFAIGTLYKFFKNKEELYKNLVLEQSDRFHETLTKAIKEPDDEIEKLRNYIRAKGEIFRDNVSMIRLYFAETRGASFNIMAGLDSEIREQYGGFLQNLATVFETGIKRKRFKKITDPYHLAVALDSITNAFLFLWLEAPESHPYPENPDHILDIMLKGLIDSHSGDELC